MACLVKRSQTAIDSVYLPGGEVKSTAYYDILSEIKKGIPSDVILNVKQSLEGYVGKFIKNSTDNAEVALGLYANLYSKDFKSWYGNDWTTTGEEPKVEVVNGMKVFKNSKGEIRSIYNTGSQKQGKAEYYRSVASRKTGELTDYVRKTVQVLNLRIKEARQLRDKVNNNPKLSFEERTKQAKRFNDIISDSIEKKNLLKEKNELEYLYLTAETDLDMAADVLFNSSRSTMGDIRIAHRAVEAWKNIAMVLGVKDLSELSNEDASRISAIEARAIEQSRRLTDLSVKLIAKTFSNPNKEIKAEDLYNHLKGLKNVGWISSQTRDISTTGIPLVNLLAKVIQEANLKIDKEHNKNYQRIDDAHNKIKNNAEIKANGFSIFFKEQSKKFGDNLIKTLGLVGRYSQNYYDTMRAKRKVLNNALEAAGNDNVKKKDAYDQYNTWVAKNTILFNAIPFLEESKYTDDQRVKVVNELLAQGFTRDEIADIVKESERLYNKFLDQKERYRIGLEVDYENDKLAVPDGQTKEKYINDLVEKWDNDHNPIKFIDQMMQPKLIANYAYKGMYYTIKIPRKTVDNKDTGYYDQNFSRIAADKDLYEFYTFFRDFIKENLSYLPEEEIDDLQSNFLPVITEKIAVEYGLTNLKETTKGLGDWFMKTFTSVEYQRREVVDPVTGKKIYNLQPKFINEEVPIEDRSKDMVVMMKMFGDMGLVYKHKLQVQDYVDAMNEIVQNTSKTQKVNNFGETLVETVAPKNTQAMVESEIKRSFYGAPVEESMVVQGRKFYNAKELLTAGLHKSEKYKKAQELEAQIKDLTKELEKDSLTDIERVNIEKEINKLKSEHSNLGGRLFSITKTLDSNIKYSRLVALAFQPFSALRNLLIGGVNNVIHATGGRDFNSKDLRTATAMIKGSITKFWTKGNVVSKDAAKLLKFMLDTGTVEGEDGLYKANLINKKTTADKILDVLPNAFTLMKGTDFLFKSQTALSMALNTNIVTEKGNVNLYKALTDNLEFNEELYGKYNPELNNGLEFEELYDKFMLKNGQVAKKLHGLATNRTGVMGKDNVMGRLLFLFKSWLPETLANRYEARKYDEFLERDVEGYMRTFGRLAFVEQGLPYAFKAMLRATFSDNTDDMNELERENLRKAFAELVAIIATSAIYFTIKGLAPDEDDEDRKKWNMIINQMELLQRDLTFYVDTDSLGDLTSQMVPSITSLNNLKTALAAAFYHYPAGITGLETNDDGEPLYDGERTILKITKAVPGLNNINRMIYYQKKLSDAR
jgi:hypothetical protein